MNILLDFMGGALSLGQQLLTCWWAGNFTPVTANPGVWWRLRRLAACLQVAMLAAVCMPQPLFEKRAWVYCL